MEWCCLLFNFPEVLVIGRKLDSNVIDVKFTPPKKVFIVSVITVPHRVMFLIYGFIFWPLETLSEHAIGREKL